MNKQDAQKINEALELLNEAAHGQKKEFSDLLSDKYGDLKKAVMELEGNVEDSAREGVDRLRELKEAAASQARNTASQVDRRAHEDPWKTLGWSVVGAFVAGLLLGRKD